MQWAHKTGMINSTSVEFLVQMLKVLGKELQVVSPPVGRIQIKRIASHFSTFTIIVLLASVQGN